MDPTTNQARGKMQKAFEVLHHDFATVHIGKANPSLVENILVTAYGEAQKFKLLELATIHVQDPKTIVITPFDQSIIADIQKGIYEANLGLSPAVNANIIRINLPPLTEERRKELVKLVSQKAESGKVMIRQIRHEAMEDIKKRGEGNSISEDDVTRLEKEVQRVTDEFIEKIDTLRHNKEEELMSI
ncbi:MAG: ribosome recycling factor [Candidatus Levybacteria bacterium RIFCSPHIGHO2_01_FULL_36_15]|nr:MAG: ribosome recycling factor [Candidatus Levybacteria bacterium RIFCSPHIGHO2_01_FULL_36_15]